MSKERLLIPLDGSEFSQQILPWVRRCFKPSDVALLLLQAVPPHSAAPEGLPGREAVASGFVHDADRYRQHMTDAERYYQAQEARQCQSEETLRQIGQPLREAGYAVEIHVSLGDPAPAIVDYTRRCGVTAIAMATHGRGGWRRVVLGSVADQILRTVSIPVFMLRPSAHTPP
jgi:nucleotide-binding universal stress UspA family protein